MTRPTDPNFWRDSSLPYVEARSIEDGRALHYDRHAHEHFSIGAITAGSCVYLNGRVRQRIHAGSVVLMNPGDVHACNPIAGARWSYRMLYIDIPWLLDVQRDLGVNSQGFRPFATNATRLPRLYGGLNRLYEVLIDERTERLAKDEAAFTFMRQTHLELGSAREVVERRRPRGIARAAEFIRDHRKHSLKLEEICAVADVSASYLIRAFKAEYGMTPHAYLLNCRIEFSRERLRKGVPIATVAAEAGFADQAHLQRTFKRLVAATPGQYRAQPARSGPVVRRGVSVR